MSNAVLTIVGLVVPATTPVILSTRVTVAEPLPAMPPGSHEKFGLVPLTAPCDAVGLLLIVTAPVGVTVLLIWKSATGLLGVQSGRFGVGQLVMMSNAVFSIDGL